jgi:hypothetical protein
VNDHFRRLLEGNSTGQWVRLDVAQEALGVDRRRALQLAKSEGWRVAPGTRPREYSFEDIRTTWKHRQQPAPRSGEAHAPQDPQ